MVKIQSLAQESARGSFELAGGTDNGFRRTKTCQYRQFPVRGLDLEIMDFGVL